MKLTKTNPEILKIADSLKEKSKKEDAAIWKVIANKLVRPTRKLQKSTSPT